MEERITRNAAGGGSKLWNRSGALQILERRQIIPRDVVEVFQFFSQAGNLELITPPDLKFEIITPEQIAMTVGTLIDYRIRLHGVPLRWRTRIDAWNPPHSFVDNQLRGPYRVWIHHHEFRSVAEGTEMSDKVWYRLPPLGPLAGLGRALVGRQLNEIFDYRAATIAELFEGVAR